MERWVIRACWTIVALGVGVVVYVFVELAVDAGAVGSLF